MQGDAGTAAAAPRGPAPGPRPGGAADAGLADLTHLVDVRGG